MVQDRVILKMADQQKYGLSNGAIFNYLELSKTKCQGHSLTLNITETVRDTDIVTMNYTNRDLPVKRVILNDLEWLSEIFNDTKHRAVSLRQLSL